MRALITGGAGFIGSHLADRLLERGDQVVLLCQIDAHGRVNFRRFAAEVEGSRPKSPEKTNLVR